MPQDNEVLNVDLHEKLQDIRTRLVATSAVTIREWPDYLDALITSLDQCIVLNNQRNAAYSKLEEKVNPAFGR